MSGWKPWVHSVFYPTAIDGHRAHRPFYMPYICLLYDIFGKDGKVNFGLTIHEADEPDYLASFEMTHSVTEFIKTDKEAFRRIFFMKIRATNDLINPSQRAAADGEMLAIFNRFVQDDVVDIPVMYGIYAFGRRICFYEFHTATGAMVAHVPNFKNGQVGGIAPVEQWYLDILSEEGEDRLRQVADHIKTMNASVFSGCCVVMNPS